MTGAGPVYHLAPARGWVNDPNGMTRRDGRWHVFHQHNPAGPFFDRIAWGHASSTDLVTWREHPTAFAPTAGGPDEFGCWSGVFVDGLGRPAMVYTGVTHGPLDSTICLRWGSEDLESWDAPVVVTDTPRADGIREMRDPFVFRWGGRRWALVGAGFTDGTPGVLLFGCDDVLHWEYRGVWLSLRDSALAAGSDADIWECPQLVTTGDEAAVLLSLNHSGVTGRVVVAVGRLGAGVGGIPSFEADSAGPYDTGTHLFAPQVLLDDGTGEGPLLVGWVRDDDPGREHGLPDEAVVGCLSLPRRVSVDGGRLVTRPDPALRRLLGPAVPLGPGEHLLEATCRVEIGRSSAHARVGDGLILDPVGLDLGGAPPGTQVWVDGPVVEVYPGDGSAPATFRRPAVLPEDPDRARPAVDPWMLRVPETAVVTVAPVVPHGSG
ncbi:MAG: glycoside hydrolase family 32 protein [Phycicoccus sp.]